MKTPLATRRRFFVGWRLGRNALGEGVWQVLEAGSLASSPSLRAALRAALRWRLTIWAT